MGARRRDVVGVGVLKRAAHTLATPRLALRPCTTADVDALHALWTDAAVRRWLWDDIVIDRATAADVVAASEASFAARGFGQWCVEVREGDGLVGFAGLREVQGQSDIEVLYGFLPSRWGRGLALEAARAVLAHGFETVKLTRIAGRTGTPNRASARVLERVGMTFDCESLSNDLPTLNYSITRDGFAAAAR
jgi:RimJ/RimL family protein N-acetyltransferase